MKKHILTNMMLLFCVICCASTVHLHSHDLIFNSSTIKNNSNYLFANSNTVYEPGLLHTKPVAAALFWSASQKNLLIQKGTTTKQTFTITASNSFNTAFKYNLSATYGAGASGWLSFNATASGKTPTVTYTYTKGATLAIGTYTATIKLQREGYTSAYCNIQLRVIDSKTPYVVSSTPANGATNVDVSTVSFAANNLNIPLVNGVKGGVDNTTITVNTVKLYKVVNSVSTLVTGVVQGTGGGDAISFSPSALLSPNTTYNFVITNGVRTYSGAAFIPFSATFKTGNSTVSTGANLPVNFTKVTLPLTQNKKYTNLKFGPDGKLYALRLDGAIERYTVNHSTGALSNQQIITTLNTVYGQRSAIGLVFDPAATATNLICYVTHSSTGLVNSPDFDGKLSKLTGSNLQTEKLIITNLPRSTRDHMANCLAFGPDKALYICQGSNSSGGAYDNDWKRAETLLAGAILRLDFNKLNGITLPLNVKTTATQSVINAASSSSRLMSDGTYNPYSSASPLTIYASGVRNAFDLVWHSNGQLYLPTNGSGGGGNSPASVSGTRRPDGSRYSGQSIPATTDIGVQTDWLFRVNPLKSVGYFGHPNPLRGEYVENRGPLDNALYPANIVPDSRYRGAAYNFGLNHSPDGAIEYKSNTFGGALKNKLIVCRFSGGGDLVVMKPGSLVKVASITGTSNDKIYDITEVTNGIEMIGTKGMSGFTNPINLVEDTQNGNLYVIEYNWNNLAGRLSQITLLKVASTSGATQASLAVSARKTDDMQGLANFKSYDVKLSNDGEGILRIKNISVIGAGASNLKITGIDLPQETDPLNIDGKSSVSFAVTAPANYSNKSADILRITSIDDSVKDIPLTFLPEVSNSVLDTAKIGYANKPANVPATMVLYPNPDRGQQLNVVLKGFKGNENATIYLFDIMGNQIKSLTVKTAADGSIETALPLPQKSANVHMYIVRAVSGSVVKEGKVMLQ